MATPETITGLIRNTKRLDNSPSGNPRYVLAIESAMGYWHETRRYTIAKDSHANLQVQDSQSDGSLRGGFLRFTIVNNEITKIEAI